ncbi:MAG TPA: M23 family metallopeptidase [Streptosporangiaceae bacterium]|nr:M23 family metallopeptidase [Streptosporangiaceae bacterium]
MRKIPRLISRVRMPLLYLAAIDMLTWWWHDIVPLGIIGVIVVVLALVSMYLPFGQVRRDPIVVRPPVLGRWLAVNSPADRVPSHGVHAYAQSYAIDLVRLEDDGGGPWKALRAWPPARRARRFAGFGAPVYAVAGGVVVKAAGRQRDHWSRNSWPGLLFLFIEGSIREVLGPRFLFGNHVIVDMGDGVYAAYAHLRRGSVRVRPGQRVSAGERLAECGNSGNSSEPHLHFQLMDRRNVLVAAGLPFAFDRYEIDGGVATGVPAGRRPFIVSRPSGAEADPAAAHGYSRLANRSD